MSNGDGESDGQGGRSQASVSPLVSHGEDANHKLHGEEHLHSGGHSQADARLQLEIGRKRYLKIIEITIKPILFFFNCLLGPIKFTDI